MIKDGIINLNKPAGMTSHDCVQALRRLTGIKRIGHTGTLDPMATGVLPLCIGSATRIMEYLDLDLKVYRCAMRLGVSTDTQDIWGKAILDRGAEIRQRQHSGEGFTKEEIKAVFSRFCGLISQTPPKYSALKVGGRKLYEYARAGEPVEIKERKVWIKTLDITDIDFEEMLISFDVTCSKGTYIRTICSDVGDALGCGGAMFSLKRLASGVFSINDAVALEELKPLDEEKINALIREPDYPLVHFGKAILDEDGAGRFQNGGQICLSEVYIGASPEFERTKPPFPIREEYQRAYNVYEGAGGRFLGVAFAHPEHQKLMADKVFSRRQSNETV